jgi:hypothetical protein
MTCPFLLRSSSSHLFDEPEKLLENMVTTKKKKNLDLSYDLELLTGEMIEGGPLTGPPPPLLNKTEKQKKTIKNALFE